MVKYYLKQHCEMGERFGWAEGTDQPVKFICADKCDSALACLINRKARAQIAAFIFDLAVVQPNYQQQEIAFYPDFSL